VSHDNSRKDHRRQPEIVRDVAAQVAEGERGIVGVMIESNLVEGRQDLDLTPGGAGRLVYGQSITDACLGWNDTEPLLRDLASAARARRAAGASSGPSASRGSRNLAKSR